MYVLISPAKTLDFESEAKTSQYSQPSFQSESQQLIDQLRQLQPNEISNLMSISDKLGLLNFGRFHDWSLPFSPDNAKQAVLAFQGDVYSGLAAETFDETDFEFAQGHLRILSGLYGLLKPLDLIQPYRLEMGTKFSNTVGKNLYEFWGDKITALLEQQMQEDSSQTLINLASNEYFKSVKTNQLSAEVVTPVFKDWKGDRYKIISFYAKKARGMMAAYIIKNRITDAEAIKQFDLDGYGFEPTMSNSKEWVFTRKAV